MRKFIITILILLNLPANAQLNTRIVENELSKLVNDGKLVSNDILNWITTDNTFSNENGINHFYIRQGKNNLEINGTESGIHILSDGTVLTSNINFIKNLDSKITGLSIPNISAIQAVKNVALELGYTVTEQLTVLERNNTVNQKQLISQGGISSSKIPVRLMYHRLQNDNVVLVWDLSIESSQKNEWYNLKVDASTGVIVDKINWMLTCDFPVSKIEKQSNFVDKIEKWNFTKFLKNENFLSPNSILSGTYNVFGLPLESPYYGSRSLVTNIENLNASPYGWHDTNGILGAEYTVTRGNNVNAFKGSGTSLFQPNGGPNLVFDYPLNLAFSTTTPSEAASITNLFYYNNIIHDVMYNYGFGEINGNFQTLNYNSGSGLGNDPVNARAQIRNWGNATFSTPPDGTSPSMSMYYNGTQDGNLENLVIAHEYGHGISNRLTGGPTNVSCLDNNEQMGEGWSDWYGLMLSMEAGDTNTTSRTVGNYLFNQGINGSGIRPFPYNTMMTVNPQTYNAIKTAAIDRKSVV